MSEKTLDEDQVREEHLAEVVEWHQWAYLIGVLVGGTGLMLAFIAILGSTA